MVTSMIYCLLDFSVLLNVNQTDRGLIQAREQYTTKSVRHT